MSDVDLTSKQELLLKEVRTQEEPTHSSLHEDKEVEELEIKKRTVESIMRSLEDEGFVKSSRPKNSKVYALTEKGNKFVSRLLKRERQKEEELEEELGHENMIQEFQEFFEERENKKVQEAGIGKSYVELDIEALMRFNVDLGEKLFDKPEKVFTACREAIRTFPEISESKNIRPINISDIDSHSLSELDSGDIDSFVATEGTIQSVTGNKSKLTSAIFQCETCGDRYEKDQSSNGKLTSPFKCDCGGKKFSVEKKVFQSVRVLHIKEKPEKSSRQTLPVVVEGDLAEDSSKNLDALGSGIKVYGYVEPYKEKKSSDLYDHRLKAKNLEIEKDMWEDLEIDEEDLEEIQQISKREDLPGFLSKSLAHEDIAGRELLKESFIVYLLSRNDKVEENVHFLCIGEPSTGKSQLTRILNDKMPRVVKTSVSSGTSKVGLTGAVQKNEVTKEWEAEAGAIPMVDGGFHITDEVDKLVEKDDGLLSAFNEPLSDKQITLNKANIHAELPADVSEFAVGNPKSRRFHDDALKYEQNPIEKADINSRFPIKLAVEEDKPSDENGEELQREKVRTALNSGSDFSKEEEDLIPTDEVVKYIAHAQEIVPDVPESINEEIEGKYIKLWGLNADSNNIIDLRFAKALKSISIAYAKMDLADEVSKDHVQQAYDFVKRCYESLDVHFGDSESTEGANNPERAKKNRVIKAINRLRSDPRSSVSIPDIKEEVSMRNEEIEEILQSMKFKGEILEVSENKIEVIEDSWGSTA